MKCLSKSLDIFFFQQVMLESWAWNISASVLYTVFDES